jgi:hypothetical protein
MTCSGYTAAGDILQWRTGDFNKMLPASVLGKVARLDTGDGARKKNRLN